ncbi:MAG: hypothetical protein JWM86_2287 [Thermoleophilia bacterium]|nr:hypothetical protein [Thermoleophilia bacterium]
MSRRIVAPLLLLLAAACSLAAVFGVHRIESSGGPVSEPFASRFHEGRAQIRFTTREPEDITLTIRDARGRTVATLLEDTRIDGPTKPLYWDGTDDRGARVPDGEYRVRITRAGDPRSYGPARPIVVDATPPRSRLDKLAYVDGELRGLVVTEPRAVIVVEDSSGARVRGVRSWVPKDGTVAARTTRPVPAGSLVIRFSVPPQDPASMGSGPTIYAIDAAGNRTRLHGAAGRSS